MEQNNMSQARKVFLFLLRLSMGWLFLYAGITKVFNPEWSAAGYLKGAKTFEPFFSWLLEPGILPVINFLNEWGLTLLGASLIVGLLVSLSSYLGALLMLLYYLPALEFPYIGTHSLIVDEHIIYILVLVYLALSGAGRIWGLDSLVARWRGKG